MSKAFGAWNLLDLIDYYSIDKNKIQDSFVLNRLTEFHKWINDDNVYFLVNYTF